MPDRSGNGISIFKRILLALLLVNLTVALALLITGYDFVRKLVERRATESIGQQVELARERFVEQYAEDIDQWLRWLIGSSHIDDFLYAPATEQRVISKRIERLLKTAVDDFDGVYGASFVDSGGRIVVVAPPERRGERGLELGKTVKGSSPASSAQRLGAMSKLFAELKSTPLLISSGAMEWFMPPRRMQIEGPFVNEDELVSALAGLAKLDVDTGLFGGAVLLNIALDPFLEGLRDVTFLGERVVWVLGANGEVLERPEGPGVSFDPRTLLPSEPSPALGFVRSELGIVAYQDFSLVDDEPFVRVAAVVPRSLLLGDLAPAIRYFSAVIAVSLLIAIFVSLYVSRYLSRPIVELASAAVRLARGDLTARVDVRTTGEVQTLVDSFNSMTEDLRESIAARDDSMASLRSEIAERERIEQELRQQARDLDEARAAAESAGRAKGDFLATMSHEIRTPINGVLGMTELLLAGSLDDRQRRLAETAKRSGESLLEIINDILDFSKIEAGKLELFHEPFDLRELIEDVGEMFSGLAHHKRIELAFSLPPDAHTAYRGDAGRLRQVLVNLVGNALKFTDRGEVVVSFREVARDAARSTLRFEVRDTGIGISEEARARIFDAFSQGDGSSTRPHGGTGLGLGISRELVRLFGGEMGVQSSPGRGSRFWFTVALDALPSASAASPSPLETARGHRVLVVDDNSTNRDILCGILESWGVEHQAVGDAAHALEALRGASASSRPFELMLVDARMPGINGLDLARAVKTDTALARTAIAIMSSVSDDFADVRREYGIEAHLTKPVRQDELRRCISILVTGSPSEDAGDSPTAAPDDEAPMGLSVLVAEDNPVNQEVAVNMLELLGCRAAVAADGRAAIDAFEADAFDVILMDCQMPGMDGYEATARIRAIERDRGSTPTPIIALTANAFSDVRERCLNVGMDEQITKPYTTETLRAALGRFTSPTRRSAIVERKDSIAQPPADAALAALEPDGECATLDMAALGRLCSIRSGESSAVIERFTGIFTRASDDLLSSIRTAIDAGDAQSLNEAAHALKSSSASMGANELSSLCRRLEEIGADGDLAAAPQVLARVEAEYAAVCRALRRLGAAEQAA